MGNYSKIKLSDYETYPFQIPDIFLNFTIYDEFIYIISSMHISPKSDSPAALIFKGSQIELQKILVNNSEISKDSYILNHDILTINNIPNSPFTLDIYSRINPFSNTSLEGLYSSCGILVSQCEAEGFRRICFHPDRPDVLSRYKVRIEACKDKYPILLSNGNKLNSSLISNDPSRHEVTWEDPFPKPSYLFALVAGKLSLVQDNYLTHSGRYVSIDLYVEPGDERFTTHAIQSLKRAMKWDEDVFGLEYDLNLYNIVAIRHFNMGAMENKGLNIFNSKLILADVEITTDDELQRIESVIAHEYFHNWTGNRITCRDWFQLSLKEGLTVFRDQSFTSDIHYSALKRIEDVSLLRSVQFKEDSGPTSHPVKPTEYVSIDNFYTTTIYEKGAEIIRMLQTLVGKENFIAGIKNYIKLNDGLAVTTEDFVNSLIEGATNNGYKTNFDIKQFNFWYSQPGTPSVNIIRQWDSEKQQLKLTISQKIQPMDQRADPLPLVIPIKVALYFEDYSHLEKLLILDEFEKVFILDALPNQLSSPIISVFRNFSAPVKWTTDLSLIESQYLIKNDNDIFSKWNLLQNLVRELILLDQSNHRKNILEESSIILFRNIINNYSKDTIGFLAAVLKMPSLSELELDQEKIDPIYLYQSSLLFSSKIANILSDELHELLDKCYPYRFQKWPIAIQERKLIESIWNILIYTDNHDIKNHMLQAVSSSSMSLSRAALSSLIKVDCPERDEAMNIFYQRWKDNPIILDTWFLLESSIYRENSLEVVNRLLNHHLFDPLAPNSLRAVLGGFTQNIRSFHALDESGYSFMADQILLIDKRNPITASRLVKVFSKWKSYVEPYSSNMFNSVKRLHESELSSNTREIIELMIK